MSCLMVSELPLSDQVAIELVQAERLRMLAMDVITLLDSPAVAPPPPAPLPLVAGESDSIRMVHAA